jgi:hypothetical protein
MKSQYSLLFTGAHNLPLSWAKSVRIFHAFPSCILKTHINIYSPPCLGLKSGFLLSCFPTKVYSHLMFLPYVLRAPTSSFFLFLSL